MEPGIALGSTGLAISIITTGQQVLDFLIKWVENSKHYGEDVRSFKTRLTAESARLQAFVGFMKQQSAPGLSRYNELSEISQRAISGMVQELELAFDSYTTLINKYKIEDLQRGYEIHMSMDSQNPTTKQSFQVVADSKKASKAKQKEASYISVSAWGLFRKKRIEELINTIGGWNDRLQNFLLCGLCFGKGSRIGDFVNQPVMETLHLSAGLKLRSLVLEDIRGANDFFKTDWILEKVANVADARIQRLTMKVQGRSADSTTEHVFVEYKEFKLQRHESRPSYLVMKRVALLAKLLSQPQVPESGFRTLQCAGVVMESTPRRRFVFVFRLPQTLTLKGSEVTSIASAIAPKYEHRPTLGEKFKMARSLEVSLFNFHSVNWLHKSIRSENILFFCNGSSEPVFYNPLLVGFEFSRAEKDTSNTDQDGSLARNIYRHPDKQGQPEERLNEVQPEKRFNVLHDIYALGAVLLEIGLWRSLLTFDKNFDKMTPEDIKVCLEAHARERLPHYMGMEYTEAVLACLQGAMLDDREANRLGSTVEENVREQILSAFWEKVVQKTESGAQLG